MIAGRKATLMLLLGGFMLFQSVGAALGQSGRSMPKPDYYAAPFADFYQGNFRRAINFFERHERSGFRFGTQRYLDSVCYWTMMGECHYRAGNYTEALRLYEAALTLYLQFQQSGWQGQLQGIPAIQIDNAAINRARINWGESARLFSVTRPPRTFPIMIGRLDAELAFVEGGVLMQPEIRQLDVTEVMRCAAVAIQRRKQILGPTSAYSAFSNQLAAALRAGQRVNREVMGPYNGVLLGMAQSAEGDYNNAAMTLRSSLQYGNQLDHPLTAIALLELARIAVATEDYASASNFALEASYSAAFYDQYDVIEDALNLGAQIHMFQGRGVYQPLIMAVQWAKRDRAFQLYTSLAVTLAECHAEVGSTANAAAALELTNHNRYRDALNNANMLARVNYVRAVSQFQTGDFATGMASLNLALTNLRLVSPWLFRLSLAETLITSGAVRERQADLLYGALLRDPDEFDWRMNPLDSLAFLASPHVISLERWFEIVVSRRDYDRAIEIAEMTSRHRFFAQLPMGGRFLAFRWIMHGPVEGTDTDAQKQRQALLARFPDYQQFTDRANQIYTALELLPKTNDDDPKQVKEVQKLLTELQSVSLSQDSFLANLSLRRIPANMIFPPQYRLSELRRFIEEDQLVLFTFSTSAATHLFFVNANNTQYLTAVAPRDLQRMVGGLLKEIGVSEKQIDADSLSAEDWKERAAEIGQQLWGEITPEMWANYRELVIIPDGLLWYLPFEIIQSGEGEERKTLFDLIQIRYSPLLSLAFFEQRPKPTWKSSAAILTPLQRRGKIEVVQAEFDQLAVQRPEMIKFESLPQANVPQMLMTTFDHVLVWEGLAIPRNTNPLNLQVSSAGNRNAPTLLNQLSLPLKGPDQIVLPNFDSDAASGLRNNWFGGDLFTTSVALMGSGSRSILISRWATEGSNSLLLSRHYSQRLWQQPSAQAHRESVDIARQADLDFEQEPKIRFKATDPTVPANHPFFWAGLMRMEIPAPLPNTIILPADDQDVEDQENQEDQEGQEDQCQNQLQRVGTRAKVSLLGFRK